MAGAQVGKKKNELWSKSITALAIVVIVYLAMSLRIILWSAHKAYFAAHLVNRPSFWAVALLSIVVGLVFGQVKGNFRPLVAILAVVILFVLVMVAEMFFRVPGAYE